MPSACHSPRPGHLIWVLVPLAHDVEVPTTDELFGAVTDGRTDPRRSAWDVAGRGGDQQAETHRHPLVTRQAEHSEADREVFEVDP